MFPGRIQVKTTPYLSWTRHHQKILHSACCCVHPVSGTGSSLDSWLLKQCIFSVMTCSWKRAWRGRGCFGCPQKVKWVKSSVHPITRSMGNSPLPEMWRRWALFLSRSLPGISALQANSCCWTGETTDFAWASYAWPRKLSSLPVLERHKANSYLYETGWTSRLLQLRVE